jgi:Baseplate J-like protein
VIYSCCNQNRKNAVLQFNSPSLNGIDYLEVLDSTLIAPPGSPPQQTLLLHCLLPVTAISASNVLIQGGESITNISVSWVVPAQGPFPAGEATSAEQQYLATLTDQPKVLVIRTNKAGDFSPYTLRLVNNASTAATDTYQVSDVLTGFDTQLASVQFSFKVECGPNFDCAPQPPACPPTAPAPPPINYLAKDFGSFRTIILDRLNQLLPGWNATSEADLGVALAELVAYVGDLLSYQQDAIATEAYLETARSRVSLRRHAFLMNYTVHDGCNARAWIQVQVAAAPGTPVILDRTRTRFYTFAPGMPSSLAVGSGNEAAAVLAGVVAFEPVCDAILYPENNQISFYTWGDTNCCLPAGATEATLLGPYPNLQEGDVLIFQEMKGPQTGNTADADIRHRCAVRLSAQPQPLQDPLNIDATGKAVQLTEIQWSSDDALPFPVCISSSYLDSTGDTQTVTDVSIAFGNVVLADHGLSFPATNLKTVPPPRLYLPANPAADRCTLTAPTPLPVRYRPKLPESPITQAVAVTAVSLSLTSGVNPQTSTPILLNSPAPISLFNSSGAVSLSVQPTNSAGWPSSFGVLLVANAGNFDISVVYNPPGGAAGISGYPVVEHLSNISFHTAASQINSSSRFLQVPASYMPPAAAPASYPKAPTMLSNTGPVNLQDTSNPPVTYLTLAANNPQNWPAWFGIRAPSPPNSTTFEIQLVYIPSPSGGVGSTPITVEDFTNLTLATVASAINNVSALITVTGIGQTLATGLSAYDLMNFDPDQAVPAITLTGTYNNQNQTWTPLQNLLECGESSPNFVVEVEADGTATLRFGDNTNGKAPDSGTQFTAQFRIGNGTAGNVGADSLVYLAAVDPRLNACRNPLPAVGGTDPETNDQIRRRAPQAFLTQERAVTMQDYETVTESNPQVDNAVASLRWTGSWYTVFIAVEPQGGGNLTTALAQSLESKLESYRLAGQDLQLDSPQYVSLEIELQICVDPSYFQSDVQQSLVQVLGDQIMPNGQKGLFYPDNFTFGQTVYLSPVYAAARSVPGVVAVTATKFQPQGVNTSQYLTAGEIPLGTLQVARLENDPNYPNHGQLTLNLEGGK